MPYRKSAVDGTGQIVDRNGIPSMDIRPAPFYKNLDDGTVSGILRSEFLPNMQYVINLWIDADDVISGGNNVAAGMIVMYSDGTHTDLIVTGNSTTKPGFQNKKLVTTAGKSVNRLEVYYYTSSPTFYRLDSIVTPFSNLSLYKSGVFDAATFTEDQTIASFTQGGAINGNNFIEI